jgi:hypothetical protein
LNYLLNHAPLEHVAAQTRVPINDYQKKKWERQEREKEELIKKLELKYQKM